MSIASSTSGCIKTANVLRDTPRLPWDIAVLTKCGVALRRPPEWICIASPTWNTTWDDLNKAAEMHSQERMERTSNKKQICQQTSHLISNTVSRNSSFNSTVISGLNVQPRFKVRISHFPAILDVHRWGQASETAVIRVPAAPSCLVAADRNVTVFKGGKIVQETSFVVFASPHNPGKLPTGAGWIHGRYVPVYVAAANNKTITLMVEWDGNVTATHSSQRLSSKEPTSIMIWPSSLKAGSSSGRCSLGHRLGRK